MLVTSILTLLELCFWIAPTAKSRNTRAFGVQPINTGILSGLSILLMQR